MSSLTYRDNSPLFQKWIKEAFCIGFELKKYRTAWGMPDGPWVDKEINILPNLIAFHRDNDIKLKFVRRKKVIILTKEVNAKKIGMKAKKCQPEKCLFFGKPISIHNELS